MNNKKRGLLLVIALAAILVFSEIAFGESNIGDKAAGAKTDIIYDANGNAIQSTFLDADGNIVEKASAGYAIVRREYDASGNVTLERYYDKDNNPTRSTGGYAGRERRYDSDGNVIWRAYLDENGARMALSDFYILHRVYENGLAVEESYYDANDNPVMRKSRYSMLRRAYDERGNVSRVMYYDLNGEPTIVENGYAGWERRYDKDGNIIWQAYLNKNGERMVVSDFSIIHRTFENGLAVEESYYDTNENPIIRANGYAMVRRTYDEHGNVARAMYYDLNGMPTIINGGFAGRERRYDKDGNIIWQAYLDENGDRMMVSGFSIINRAHGNDLTEEDRYYDVNENPVYRDEGYALLRRTYNTEGNVTLETYHDMDGNRVLSDLGNSGVAYAYDERGNNVQERYLDLSGQIAENVKGYAVCVRSYVDGKLETEVFTNAAGDTVLSSDGYARMTIIYDEMGNEVERQYYDLNGNIVYPVLPDTSA